ncbi:MAG: Ig-like domain repeat protein [Planctomycetota bacterium]
MAYDGQSHGLMANVIAPNGANLGLARITYSSGDVPTAVGTYTATATFDGNYLYNGATATTTITITKITPTIALSGLAVLYNGQRRDPVAQLIGPDGGVLGSASLVYDNSATPTNAGQYPFTASFAGDNNLNAVSRQGTLTIRGLTPAMELPATAVDYDGQPHPVSVEVWPTVGLDADNVTFLGMATISYSTTDGSAPVQPGYYTVTASFAGQGNYAARTITSSITIYGSIASSGKQTPVLTIDPVSAVYDGSSHLGTGHAYGSGGLDLGAATITYGTPDGSAPVNAGTYNFTATYAGNYEYDSGTVSSTIVISKAASRVVINSVNETFDGQAHTIAGRVYSDLGVDLGAATITYPGGSAPTHAGTYAITASFAGNGNYLASSATATLTVAQAVPTINISSPITPYDGTSHSSSARVIGLNGVDLGAADITYDTTNGQAPVNAGTYGLTASYGGSQDYAPLAKSGTIQIMNVSPGTTRPSFTLSPLTVAYNGQAHGLTANVLGTDGGVLAPALIYYSSGTAPVEVGTYTVTAIYGGDQTYATSVATTTITIQKVTPTIQVSGYSVAFDGQTHTTTGEVYGLNGVVLGQATISYSTGDGSAPVHGGTYTVTASFAGNSNYAAASTTATITITRVAPTIVVQPATATYDGTAHGTSGTVYGLGGALIGSATMSYTGGTTPVHAGSYTATAGFAGNDDYSPATATATVVIGKATPTVTFSPIDVPFSGRTPSFTVHATGVTGEDLGLATISYELGSAPTAVGIYNATAAFAGSQDYLSGLASSTVTIHEVATTTIGLSGASVSYGSSAVITLTVSAASGTPTGSVSLTVDSGTPLTATLANGVASFTIAGLHAGSHTIQGDYDVTDLFGTSTATISYTVNQAAITLTLGSTSQVYGTPANLGTALPGTLATGINGENLQIAYSSPGNTAATVVGGYAINGVASSGTGLLADYAVTFTTGTLTVTPAPLTVTGSNRTMPTGSTPATQSGIITGLKNGDTFPASYSTTATATSAAGAYPVTGLLSDYQNKLANYSVSYVNGTLTLAQRQFSVGSTVTSTVGPDLTLISLGTYLDADAANWPTTYTATATWTVGGTPQAAQLNVSGGSISVSASHPYNATGTNQPVVTIRDTGGSTFNLVPTVRADFTPPTSTASSPVGTPYTTFTVTLGGTDPGAVASGVKNFAVYASANGGSYSFYNTYTAVSGAASFTYTGVYGSYYSFRSIATDNIGNVEQKSGTDTTTIVSATPTITGSSTTATSNFGTPLTLSVAVTTNFPGIGTPTGSLEFYDNTTLTSLGTFTLVNGVASVSSNVLAVGVHQIALRYSGDSRFQATVGSYSQTVRTSIYVTNNSTAAGSTTGKLYLSSGAVINVPGRVVVNSPVSPAVTLAGTSQIVASAIQVAGVVQRVGTTTTISPTPLLGASQAVSDPLINLQAPVVSGTAQSISLTTGSMTINPGIYSQIKVSGSASLTMNPGVYVITSNGFVVMNTASVTGVGVMIHMANSAYPAAGGSNPGVTINTTGNLNLSAPATGAYAGILLFQSRSNNSAMTITGTIAQQIKGTIYASNATLTVGGSTILRSALVVSQLQASGTVQILGTGNASGTPNSVALSSPAGVVAYNPAQVRTTYGISQLAPATDGTGQTIAIVGAYHSPNLAASVDAFDNQFGLAANSPSLYAQYGPAGSFLTVVNQNGSTANPPTVEPAGTLFNNWSHELISNVQWAHAIAPGAKIVVVEATSASLPDLMTAAQTAAAQPGVSVVSMSWGFQEGLSITAADEKEYDRILNKPGVIFVASSGNSGGYRPQYPATSPNVIAVGGTSLQINPDGTRARESLWQNTAGTIGSGFGTSLFEQAPAYQAGSSTGRRQVPDVSMVADPTTGLQVADTSAAQVLQTLGGTSLAAPIWAGLMALVNQARLANGLPALNTASPTEAHQALYNAPTGMFNRVIDITDKSTVTSPSPSPTTGLGTPVANKLVTGLASTRFSQMQAIDTAIDTIPATSRLAAATGSMHASPIASAQPAQPPKRAHQPSPKPVAIKPPTPSASNRKFSQKQTGVLPKVNNAKTERAKSNSSGVSNESHAKIDKSDLTNDNIMNREEAIRQIIDQKVNGSDAIDTIFDSSNSDFWASRMGYRKHLRAKN